jgi:IclR helix-turn-helix domain
MESPDARRERVHREVQLKNCFRLSAIRLDDAHRERIWAIVAAYEAGLSIREIAKATGLSSSRVHQLLHDNEAQDIPDWLDGFRVRELPADDFTGTSRKRVPAGSSQHGDRCPSPLCWRAHRIGT